MSGADVDLVDGLEVPLVEPPEGGRIVFVGVHARNVSCELQLEVTAFDGCAEPDAPVGRESRPVTLVENDDGFGRPAPAAFLANGAPVPFCPACDADFDLAVPVGRSSEECFVSEQGRPRVGVDVRRA